MSRNDTAFHNRPKIAKETTRLENWIEKMCKPWKMLELENVGY